VTITSPHDPAVGQPHPHQGSAVRYGGDSWRESAACRFLDTELFFPIGKAGPAIAEIQRAKAVCARCPVRQACLTFALETRQGYGIWGGCDDDERLLLLRQRQKPRPAAGS
jgi:WhiB family redox-sensing transcriptional regulator